MSRRFSILWLGVSWLVCSVAAAQSSAQEERIEQFPNRVALTTSGNSGIYQVVLPPAIYRGAAHADLRDLRVFNAQGERVPFAFLPAASVRVEERTALHLPYFPLYESTGLAAAGETGGLDLQIRQKADGTLVTLHSGRNVSGAAQTTRRLTGYLLDASKLDQAIRALEFDWQAEADSHQGEVRVEGSDDLKSWRVLGAGALIDLEFAGQHLNQKRIELSAARAKYLRLSWSKNAFMLNGVQAETATTVGIANAETRTLNALAGDKPGEYLFDAEGFIPAARARLLLPEANTLAPTQLLVRADVKAKWRSLAAATFYRLNLEGHEVVSPAVDVNSAGERYWLARVDARSGGIGAALPKLELHWTAARIAFVARGAAPFTLAVGNADSRAASLSLSALIPGYVPGSEAGLPVAAAQANPLAESVAPAAQTGLGRDEIKRYSLWAVLLVGVAVMAWMALRLGRDMGKEGKGGGTADKKPE